MEAVMAFERHHAQTRKDGSLKPALVSDVRLIGPAGTAFHDEVPLGVPQLGRVALLGGNRDREGQGADDISLARFCQGN